MPRLSGKVALITGGGTGIGRACARLFANEGAQVVVTGRRNEPLRAVVREIEESGGQALAITCDVTQRGSVESALSGAVDGALFRDLRGHVFFPRPRHRLLVSDRQRQDPDVGRLV